MLGRSGTVAFGRSGTRISDHREPEPGANPQNCWRGAARNLANRESSGFLLTGEGPGESCGIAPPAQVETQAWRDPALTRVSLHWTQGVREDWLRFGKPVATRILDRRRRVESFAAGQVFALVRWTGNDFGTVRSSLDIVRAVGVGEPSVTVPQVEPGGDLLLCVRSWPKVRTVFELVDAIEQAGIDPCDVAPEHWRHVHNRLAAGMPPRAYEPRRHRAWLRRRKLQP